MTQKYNVVVIGTGAAGAPVAQQCRKAGWSVAIIDSEPFGGTCALRGCVPKKVYTAAAEAMEWANRMDGKGIRKNSFAFDWATLQQFKSTFTDPFPESRESGFREAGIDTYHGRAQFISENKLRINDDILQGRHFVIASGSKPRPLGIPGEEYLTTSEEFLNLGLLPDQIVFIGGGYISLEFAHVAARAGADVTVIHRGPKPLSHFDPDLVDLLLQASDEAGIRLQLNTEVTSLEEADGEFTVSTMHNDESLKFTGDLVVHGAGRVPQLDDLNLKNAGIEQSPRGVVVNEYLQSPTNHRVYAAGDAAETGPPLTPVASVDASTVAYNLLNTIRISPDYAVVPSVVFSLPPLASVGLSEANVQAEEYDYDVLTGETTDWVTSRRVNALRSGYKILVDRETDLILGAHLLGPHAQEVINLFALAMREDVPAQNLKEMIYTYPTSSSDIRSYL